MRWGPRWPRARRPKRPSSSGWRAGWTCCRRPPAASCTTHRPTSRRAGTAGRGRGSRRRVAAAARRRRGPGRRGGERSRWRGRRFARRGAAGSPTAARSSWCSPARTPRPISPPSVGCRSPPRSTGRPCRGRSWWPISCGRHDTKLDLEREAEALADLAADAARLPPPGGAARRRVRGAAAGGGGLPGPRAARVAQHRRRRRRVVAARRLGVAAPARSRPRLCPAPGERRHGSSRTAGWPGSRGRSRRCRRRRRFSSGATSWRRWTRIRPAHAAVCCRELAGRPGSLREDEFLTRLRQVAPMRDGTLGDGADPLVDGLFSTLRIARECGFVPRRPLARSRRVAEPTWRCAAVDLAPGSGPGAPGGRGAAPRTQRRRAAPGVLAGRAGGAAGGLRGAADRPAAQAGRGARPAGARRGAGAPCWRWQPARAARQVGGAWPWRAAAAAAVLAAPRLVELLAAGPGLGQLGGLAAALLAAVLVGSRLGAR